MRFNVFLLALLLVSFVSANSDEFEMICGGDEEFEILCNYNLDSSYPTITETPEIPSGGGGGSSPESSIIIIGESNETYSKIDLNSLEITTNKICLNESFIKFRTSDKYNNFTILTSSNLYFNNSIQNAQLYLDLSNETYYYQLDNLSVELLNVTITGTQYGKVVSDNKLIEVKNCNSIEKLTLTLFERLENWIRNNWNILKVICFISLFLILVIIISYAVYRINNK